MAQLEEDVVKRIPLYICAAFGAWIMVSLIAKDIKMAFRGLVHRFTDMALGWLLDSEDDEAAYRAWMNVRVHAWEEAMDDIGTEPK